MLKGVRYFCLHDSGTKRLALVRDSASLCAYIEVIVCIL